MSNIYFDFNLYLKFGQPKAVSNWFREDNIDLSNSNISLEAKFHELNNRLSLGNRFQSLKHLIDTVIPSLVEKDFYFLSADLTREKPQLSDGKANIYTNIFVRVDKSPVLESIIGKNQQLYFITDLYFDKNSLGKSSLFIVKGIELIHDDYPRDIEYKVSQVKPFSFYDSSPYSLNRINWSDSLTDADFIQGLLATYPVKDIEKALNFYQKWSQFTKFQAELLKKTQGQSIPINRLSVEKAVLISLQQYQQHQQELQSFVFDNLIDKFAAEKQDQILLHDDDKIFQNLNIAGLQQTVVKLEIDFLQKEIKNIEPSRISKKLSKPQETIKFFANPVHVGVLKFNSKRQQSEVDGISLEDTFRRFEYIVFPKDEEQALKEKNFKERKSQEQALKERQNAILLEQINNKTADEIKNFDAESEKGKNQLLAELLLKRSELEKTPQSPLLSKVRDQIKSKIRQKYIGKQRDLESKQKQSPKNNQILKELGDIYRAIEKETNAISFEDVYQAYQQQILQIYLDQRLTEKKKLLEAKQIQFKQEFELIHADTFSRETFELRKAFENSFNEQVTQLHLEKNLVRVAIYYLLPIEKFSFCNGFSERFESEANLIAAPNLIADKIKVERQKRALESFFNGFVRNPFLATFLFEPSRLTATKGPLPPLETLYTNRKLNDSQKEAIQKALLSKGLFLLQGPPGTGKTEVISEIVMQLIARNQKVIVSSETHKAIDNVFERLPHRSEIRAIRLVRNLTNNEFTNQQANGSKIESANNKKSFKKTDQAFHPSALLDNFYENITHKMDVTVADFQKKQNYLESFTEKFKLLTLLKDKYEKNEKLVKDIESEVSSIQLKITKYRDQQAPIDLSYKENLIQLNQVQRFMNGLEKFTLISLDALSEEDGLMWKDYLQKNPTPIFKGMGNDIEASKVKLNALISLMRNPQLFKNELNLLATAPEVLVLNREKEALRKTYAENQLQYGENADQINHKIALKIIEINQKIKTLLGTNQSYDLNQLSIPKLVVVEQAHPTSQGFKTTLEAMLEQSLVAHQLFIKELQQKRNQLETKKQELEDKKSSFDRLIKEQLNEQTDLVDRSRLIDLTKEMKHLQQQVDEFFQVFGINHPSNRLEDSFSVLKKEWEKQKNLFENDKQSKQKIVDTYSRITQYLKNDEVISEDRKKITTKLYELTNLVGMTCTASALLKSDAASDLSSDLVLDDFNVKEMGADVVIIDEVSKSSFFELIIPILYAKSVILVGDHRQLPPKFPYTHLQQHDVEGIDESVFNPTLKKTFEELYEKSFFQALYEDCPSHLKVMLRNQYRSHEDIMNVFNVFYSQKLKLGDPVNQNAQKQHFLNVYNKGKPILTAKHHVLFINNRSPEGRNSLNHSTSIYNHGEGDAIYKLLLLMDRQITEDMTNRIFNPVIDVNRQIDERLSVGVICTYGDQASYIKSKVSKGKHQFRGFNQHHDDRLAISTVDDFQGDERDIIILSMVRNPEGRSNPGFILDYRRINVALSRARKLLVIVGAKDYLIQKGVIDLPDIDGDPKLYQKNYMVYQAILDYIHDHGRIIEAEDLL